MLATSSWAEEKDFRGWKKGSWVRIDIDVKPHNKTVVLVGDFLGQETPGLQMLISYTIWAKIHEVSSDHLLITTYFSSRISTEDWYKELAKEKLNKPQVSPIKDKYSLATKEITEIREWPRGGEPPRPWWPL